MLDCSSRVRTGGRGRASNGGNQVPATQGGFWFLRATLDELWQQLVATRLGELPVSAPECPSPVRSCSKSFPRVGLARW
jgi:hypothetical protein